MKDPVSIGTAVTVTVLALLSVWKSRPRRWVVAVLAVVFFAFAALTESGGEAKLQSGCIGAECSHGIGIAVRLRV